MRRYKLFDAPWAGGDGRVCGAEQCEANNDCAPGAVCQGCQCVNPAACTSGIDIRGPVLALRASPFRLRLAGEAVIPKPWTGVDPAVLLFALLYVPAR